MTLSYTVRTLGLALAVIAAGACAHAQGPRGGGMRGGGGPMGMPGGGGGMRGGMPGISEGNMPHGTPPPSSGTAPTSSMRGGLQMGPPGRWWDDGHFAKTLGLNGDQQKRMDSVFGQNRDALLSRLENLKKAEQRLETLTHSSHPTESALFTEIDRVAQARADLEKANTHMLLQIRDEMTSDQINKLEDHR